ncbi:hypothetical protein [Pseudomonas phage vB_PseuGesM_254]|uniref:Tail fiber assembly protein n=1 Tax=Pseudomonas phage vB_PseuGesM_254 TaxID=3092638 RepID=A0AAX4G7W4_9CAUD|nr:hypothetical protein [Pseudomonas phage PseuGes_254]
MNRLLLALLRELPDCAECFEKGLDSTGWPVGYVQALQDSSYSVTFSDPFGDLDEVELEFNNLPYVEEYDEGDTISAQEYQDFVSKNPNWKEELAAKESTNMALIAEKNKQIAALIDEVTALAEEAGLELEIDVGQHGTLDPYGARWNSSMC